MMFEMSQIFAHHMPTAAGFRSKRVQQRNDVSRSANTQCLTNSFTESCSPSQNHLKHCVSKSASCVRLCKKAFMRKAKTSISKLLISDRSKFIHWSKELHFSVVSDLANFQFWCAGSVRVPCICPLSRGNSVEF